MVAEHHPATDIIWSVGTEDMLAFDVLAALVLCGLNLAVLMPAFFMTDLIQRLIVFLDTGLKGLT